MIKKPITNLSVLNEATPTKNLQDSARRAWPDNYKKSCRSFWGKGMEDCIIDVGFWQLDAGDWPLVKCGFEPLPEEDEKMRA